MNRIIKYSLISFVICLIILACSGEQPEQLISEPNARSENQILKIWWEQGFYPQEDRALRDLVADWEQKTGNKAKLSFYPIDSISRETERWLKAGNPPDIMFGRKAQRSLNPSLAWSGKLADVSEVIEPVKEQYPDSILEAAKLFNQKNRQRSYYGVPIHQATIHIFYWRDLLEQARFDDRQIPQTWDEFWQLWASLQDKLRTSSTKTDSKAKNIYGLGLPFSVKASDTYFTFEQILEAYDARILDTKGQLLIDQPHIRQNIIASLAWYAKFYQQGYVPPAAIEWLNPDNNRDFLNRSLLMTPNPSLSIPGTVRQDAETYRDRLGILDFPLKPNGKPMSHLVTVTQAVVFADSPREQLAKDFLIYLTQPEIIASYLKASGDRNLPVHKSVWQDPYWTNPENPHLAHAAKILTTEQTRPFYIAQNPAYSIVLQENIWGQALNRIVIDNLSPEQAAEEAIGRIKEIFNQWDGGDK